MSVHDDDTPLPASQIAFGLDRATDEASLRAYVQRFARTRLLDALLPRLSDDELLGLVDHLGDLMRRHLSEDEYHRLFLEDPR